MADVLDAEVHTEQPADTNNIIDTTAADEEFSLSLQKKKKKKKSKTVDESADKSISDEKSDSQHPATDDYTYTELLERVYNLLQQNNPNLAVRKRHVMPPPQLARIGTRKTMWSNFAAAAQVMRRQLDHLMTFVLAELGTEGSIDASQRLVIKGRYQSKQIESLLKKYIVEYVVCHMCHNPETTLSRDSVTRLYFLQCESCGSRRSVAQVKSGFHATTRAERRNRA